jgi:hypothetical protein
MPRMAARASVRPMPDQLLDRVLAEIRERLEASRGAYEESQRLEAALTALGRGRAAEPSRPRATSRRASRSRARSSVRAPRGENLRRIRELVAERPGATAAEIAAATGIARPTVASTLGKLARDGELEKTMLPSGAVGYRPATAAPAVDTPVTEAATTPVLAGADAPAGEAAAPGSDEPGEPEAPPEPTARAPKPRAERTGAKRARASQSGKRTSSPRAPAVTPSTEPPDGEPAAEDPGSPGAAAANGE